MTVRAFRITQKRYAGTAFDGEGARLHGGRWNSVGTRIVYAAGSLSLATLELLVHVEDIALIFERYAVIPVEFAESLMERIEARALPKGWDSPETIAQTQMIGDAWAAAKRSAALSVPSAVVPEERNFLLNPDHRDFAKVKIHAAFDLQPDPRLGRDEPLH